jgi:putative salt-induced outer membrane protein YdiY
VIISRRILQSSGQITDIGEGGATDRRVSLRKNRAVTRWRLHGKWIAVIALAWWTGGAGGGAIALADTIELTTGDVLRGAVIEQTSEVLVLQHPVLGRLAIPTSTISTIRIGEPAPNQVAEVPPPIGPPPALPQQQEQPSQPIVPGNPGAPPSPWQSRLELGVNAREGRTEDANVRVALIVEHKTDEHNHTFDARYAMASSHGDRTENKFTTGGHLVWPVPHSRLEYFTDLRFDYDEFNSWDERITAGLGLGYQLVDLKRTTGEEICDLLGVNVRLGAGIKREFGSDEDGLQPEGIVGADLRWTISPRQHVAAGATYFPSFEDVDEYRFVSTAEWVVRLDWMRGLSLKLGFADEYQSRTDPGIDRSAYSVFASLLIDF